MAETVGVRLPEDLLEEIENLSHEEGDDQSTTMRKLIQRGFGEVTREQAAQAYKEGRITLSEAADCSDLTLWEMEQYLVHHGYPIRLFDPGPQQGTRPPRHEMIRTPEAGRAPAWATVA